jgi:hypothetical protein
VVTGRYGTLGRVYFIREDFLASQYHALR